MRWTFIVLLLVFLGSCVKAGVDSYHWNQQQRALKEPK